GVPERTPPLDSVRPAGSVDAVEKLTAPMVLPAVKVWLNAAAAVPLFVAGFVTVMIWQPIASVYVGLTPVQPRPSVTLTVIGNVPLPVGVPESTPVAELSVRPGGKVPVLIANATGALPPLSVKVWLNGVPAVPVVTAGFWTVTPGQVTV